MGVAGAPGAARRTARTQIVRGHVGEGGTKVRAVVSVPSDTMTDMNSHEPTTPPARTFEGVQPYSDVLTDLEAEVRAAQLRARVAANAEMLRLYWTIGRTLLTRGIRGRSDSIRVERLASDLSAAFPSMRTLTRSNIEAMR